MTLLDRCVVAVNRDPEFTPASVTRAVIQTIIENTESPRTVDELTRILEQRDA